LGGDHGHFGIEHDVSVGVPCADVDTLVETGRKEVRAWVKKAVESLGSQRGHDRMESGRLQEVMVCIAVDDMDHPGAHPTGVHCRFWVDHDISVRVRCTDVASIVEETGEKGMRAKGVQLKVKETTTGIDHELSVHVRGADVGQLPRRNRRRSLVG
jgi:hypothetical protein